MENKLWEEQPWEQEAWRGSPGAGTLLGWDGGRAEEQILSCPSFPRLSRLSWCPSVWSALPTPSPGTESPLAPVILPGTSLNPDFPGASEVSWLADPNRCPSSTNLLFPSLGWICVRKWRRSGQSVGLGWFQGSPGQPAGMKLEAAHCSLGKLLLAWDLSPKLRFTDSDLLLCPVLSGPAGSSSPGMDCQRPLVLRG